MDKRLSSIRTLWAFASVAAVLVAGCSSGGSSSTTGRSSVTVVQSGTPTSLQPDVEPNRDTLRISEEIVEAATKYVWDGQNLKIAPALTTSWEQVGATTWRFHVRPNVKFTDGEALTANTFKTALDNYINDKEIGAFVVKDIHISVVDQMTFNVVTDTPNLGALPAKMSFLFIYPPDYYAGKGKAGFGQAPIGTGPYKLASWEKGVSIHLVANQGYWGSRPAIHDLVFKSVQDAATRVAQLETGQADLVADLPPALVSRVNGMSNARAESIESQRRVFYFFNSLVAPTSSVLVRQAVNYAVDTKTIISSLFQGHAYPLHGIFLPGEIGYDPSFTGFASDPNKARQLLAQAGYSTSNPLTIDMHYTTDATVLDKETAEAVQGQLQAVGIKVNMDGGPEQVINQEYGTQKATGMNMWSYGPIYNDSSFLVTVAHFSSQAAYEYEKDAHMDALGNQGLSTTDAAQRQQIYSQLENYVILEQAYWVPLYALQDIYGVSKHLKWSPRPDQNYALEVASLQ